MTMISLKRKKQELLASKVSNLVSDTNENLLRVNLSKFFTDLEAEIQKALIEYWSDTLLLQGQLNLILAPIHEKHQEYYELIMHHKLQEFKRAKQSANRVVAREQKRVSLKAAKPVKFTANRNNLFGTLKYSEDRLANNTFTATENTLNRVDGNINQILTDGYRSGAGINEVGRQITERFDQLRTWEANRIARTEIHTAQNMGIMSSYESLGVEYTQWISAGDDGRTRDSHLEVDGEIIPFGEKYSNDLSFPGDTSGPIEEWINCRCSNAPFVMPVGMMAPSFSPFKESDLVPIEVEPVQPTEPTPIEPQQQDIQTMLKGDPKITKEGNLTVYEYENNLQLAISDESLFTHEEITAHINSLPEPLRNIEGLKRIEITTEKSLGGCSGDYNPMTKTVRVGRADYDRSRYLDTLTHELSHALDNSLAETKLGYALSEFERYDKIFIADGKKFPTDYASKSWLKFKKGYKKKLKAWKKGSQDPRMKPKSTQYLEDFPESSRLYLNPSMHDNFVKEFPNRAEYLEGIYGKPAWDKNSPLYQQLVKEGKI